MGGGGEEYVNGNRPKCRNHKLLGFFKLYWSIRNQEKNKDN